ATLATTTSTSVAPTSQCTGGIPPSEVSGFLDVHNKLRTVISTGNYVAKGKLMPAAKTPIANLTWDCSIEASAQAVADTCVFESSQDRDNLGETLFSRSSSGGVSIVGMGVVASEQWESKFQQFGWSDVKFTMEVVTSGVGHATQMAWADSTQIGCGIKLCQSNTQVIVVCQYRNQGNFIDRNVYEP
ncbi:hypothetical protein PMAYCL1PPCAC_09012, partial [Pristionchus mayeri]